MEVSSGRSQETAHRCGFSDTHVPSRGFEEPAVNSSGGVKRGSPSSNEAPVARHWARFSRLPRIRHPWPYFSPSFQPSRCRTSSWRIPSTEFGMRSRPEGNQLGRRHDHCHLRSWQPQRRTLRSSQRRASYGERMVHGPRRCMSSRRRMAVSGCAATTGG